MRYIVIAVILLTIFTQLSFADDSPKTLVGIEVGNGLTDRLPEIYTDISPTRDNTDYVMVTKQEEAVNLLETTLKDFHLNPLVTAVYTIGASDPDSEVPEEMTETPNEFFDFLAKKQYDQAFALTSAQVHRGTTADQFSQSLALLLKDDMHNYSYSRWDYRSRENNQERLKGKLLFDDDTSNHVTVDLVKEAGQWRIVSFNIY